MGAHDVSMRVKGNVNKNEVLKAFRQRQDEDRTEYGTDSYNGTFSTIDSLELTDKIFSSKNEAYEFCSSQCKKWEAIAVRYKESAPFKADKAYISMQSKHTALTNQLHDVEKQMSNKMSEHLKTREFVTCSHCKSRMSTMFRSETLKCPICRKSLLSKTDLNRIESLRKKCDDLKIKIANKAKVLQENADKKNKNAAVNWLIYGVAAS